MKKFKCRTFPKDSIKFDYGKEHILVKIQYENGKELSVCLNDGDIDNLVDYLIGVRKKQG